MQKIGLNVMVINGDTLTEGHLRGDVYGLKYGKILQYQCIS
jgi:hypothetical protein